MLIQDKAIRQLIRSIANPLKLGEMGETHFVLGQHWKTHFVQSHTREGSAITVAKLRQWIDAPQAMGLPTEVQNLIILGFAGQTNRSFFLSSGLVQPTLEHLPDNLELREQVLPPRDDWDKALARAGALFSLVVPQTLNAANAVKLVEELAARVRETRPLVDSLSANLDQKIRTYLPAGTAIPRLKTVRSAQALLANLANADSGQVISVLAGAPVETSEAAMAQTLGNVKVLDEAVRAASWQLFEAVASLSDHRKPAAQAITTRIAEILAADEQVIALQPALDEQQTRALKLLTDVPPRVKQKGPVTTEREESEMVVVRQAEARDLDSQWARTVLSEIQQELDKDAAYRLSIAWKIVRQRSTS